jgi:hypothetical protein
MASTKTWNVSQRVILGLGPRWTVGLGWISPVSALGTGVVQFISEKPYAIRVISSLYKAVVRRLLTVFSLKSPECLIIALNLARYLLGIEGA